MAWLHKRKRKNPETDSKENYWSICWRGERSKTHTRAIGFLDAAEARRLLKVFEGKMAAGEMDVPRTSVVSSPVPASSTPTLAEYLENVYLPVVKRDKAASTARSARTSANALIDIMGKLPIDKVNYAVVDAYFSKRRDAGRRARTLAIELWCLRGALKHAEACEVIEDVPKLPTVKINDQQPHRYLTEAESVKLLDELRPLKKQPHRVTRGRPPITRDRITYLAVLMALNTGARKGEILSRRWEDIRWNDGPVGTLFIGPQQESGFQVKTRRSRVVPLTPELRDELRAAHERVGAPGSGWIFPAPTNPDKPRNDFGQSLRRACKRAGLPVIHPHGLRHTWASRLAMAGVDRRTLMELGGWKEGRMLDEIYAHVTDEHKAEVMLRMGLTSNRQGSAQDVGISQS